MNTVLICLIPAISHFYPTTPLARKLNQLGYNVIYCGFPNTKEVVEEAGFKFIPLTSASDEEIRLLRLSGQVRRAVRQHRALSEEIKDIVRSHRVSLMVFDIARFELYFLPSVELKIPAISFWTLSGSTRISRSIPPNSSGMIPRVRGLQFQPLFLWVRRYVRREWSKPSVLLSKFFYPYPQLRKVARQRKLRWHYNIYGPYLDNPKVILGSSHFEFPKTPSDDTVYLGLCIDEHRSKCKQVIDTIDTSKPIIYCTLGTMSKRYPSAELFYRSLIDMFYANPRWQGVIHIGNFDFDDSLPNIPENVLLVDSCPQLEIIKMSSLVLCHGGYGTIKECIYFGVPMIVFPCIFDQHGNAARVSFHKIGIACNIQDVEARCLEQTVAKMLTTDLYKENIEHMRQRALSEDPLRELFELIRTFLAYRV